MRLKKLIAEQLLSSGMLNYSLTQSIHLTRFKWQRVHIQLIILRECCMMLCNKKQTQFDDVGR